MEKEIFISMSHQWLFFFSREVMWFFSWDHWGHLKSLCDVVSFLLITPHNTHTTHPTHLKCEISSCSLICSLYNIYIYIVLSLITCSTSSSAFNHLVSNKQQFNSPVSSLCADIMYQPLPFSPNRGFFSLTNLKDYCYWILHGCSQSINHVSFPSIYIF